MQILINNAVFEDSKIKRYISKLTVEELNQLSEPCHLIDWKKHYYELLILTGLKERDIKDFVKRFYSGTKAQDSLLQSDIGSNLLVVLMYHFLEQKDQQTFSTLMIYYMIRQYGNFFRIMFKFCKPEVFEYTLNHLNPAHLFIRERTISNALFHLATEMRKRYEKYFIELNAEKISGFLYESRGRIAQSLKSFGEAYYNYESKGYGIGAPKETETGEEIYPQELEKGSRIAELVSNKICVYKEIDYKAFDNAKSLTRVNTSAATIIIKGLQESFLLNDVKFIIELFFKDIKSVNEICGKEFIPYVKKLMSLKRTSKTVYFKQEINTLLVKVIENTKFKSKYSRLTNQTQFQFNSFLAFYLTFYTKNLLC